MNPENDALRLVIFGRQGAGKGTQADRIVKHYGVIHLSTGDMFRSAIAAGTDVGRQVEPILAAGDLVSDELTIALVRERLAQDDARQSGYVLDGFPRTPAQAQALLDMLDELGQHLDAVINLDVPVEEVRARMQARGRDDDTDDSIAKRLDLYERETVPTIEWFADRDLLTTVDGLGTEDEVSDRLFAAIDGEDEGGEDQHPVETAV